MELLEEDDPVVVDAARRFEQAWAGLLDKVTPLLDPELAPVIGMWEMLETVAVTDDERLIATMFAYNVDDEYTSVETVQDRVRVFYVALARVQLDPVLLKQRLNESK